MKPVPRKSSGFTIIELLVAMAMGLTIMAAGTQLFLGGMTASQSVTQQGEMQENVRAALNLIARDVSMAASGLPQGGVALPNSATATLSWFGCEAGPTCHMSAHSYPSGDIAGATIFNQMYGIIPGPGNGLEMGYPATSIPASGDIPDSITVIYEDYSFPLSQYTASFPDTTGTTMNFNPPATPPAGFPSILSPTGIQVGDLILVTTSVGSAVGEVTAISADGGTMTFANGDILNINQSAAGTGNLASIIPAVCTTPPCTTSTVSATRLWAISYYMQVPVNGQLPRLMRQVNSHPEVPVADNIIGLNFLYDLCTGTTTACSVNNPVSTTTSPNQISKVTIEVIGQSLTSYGNRSVSTALSTSVSTRSLSFKNRYD